MRNVNDLLLKLIIPLVILFFIFTYLGTFGGIVAAVLYFGIVNNAAIFQNMTLRKYNSGDYDGALKLLEKGVRFNKRNSRIRGTYAYLLLKMGYFNEAADQIEKAISDCPKKIERNPLDVTKALVLWQQGDIDQALQIMERIFEGYKNTNMYGTLGFLYIEKGDLDKALSFNLEAYEYNSTNPIILDNLGSVRFMRGEYDEALEVYGQLLKAKPTFPAAFYNYARVLKHFGKLEDAAYMCRHALSLKFWKTSTITREKVESLLNEIEAALKAQEEEAQAKKETGTAETREETQKAGDEAAIVKADELSVPAGEETGKSPENGGNQ